MTTNERDRIASTLASICIERRSAMCKEAEQIVEQIRRGDTSFLLKQAEGGIPSTQPVNPSALAATNVSPTTTGLYNQAASWMSKQDPMMRNAIIGSLIAGAGTGLISTLTGGSTGRDLILGLILGALVGGGGTKIWDMLKSSPGAKFLSDLLGNAGGKTVTRPGIFNTIDNVGKDTGEAWQWMKDKGKGALDFVRDNREELAKRVVQPIADWVAPVDPAANMPRGMSLPEYRRTRSAIDFAENADQANQALDPIRRAYTSAGMPNFVPNFSNVAKQLQQRIDDRRPSASQITRGTTQPTGVTGALASHPAVAATTAITGALAPYIAQRMAVWGLQPTPSNYQPARREIVRPASTKTVTKLEPGMVVPTAKIVDVPARTKLIKAVGVPPGTFRRGWEAAKRTALPIAEKGVPPSRAWKWTKRVGLPGALLYGAGTALKDRPAMPTENSGLTGSNLGT